MLEITQHVQGEREGQCAAARTVCELFVAFINGMDWAERICEQVVPKHGH